MRAAGVQTPSISIAIIHQPWDEDFQEMHHCLPAVVNKPPSSTLCLLKIYFLTFSTSQDCTVHSLCLLNVSIKCFA